MAMITKKDDQYGDEEAKRRFEAALRGSRLADPFPMKDIVGKSERARRVKKTALAKPKSS